MFRVFSRLGPAVVVLTLAVCGTGGIIAVQRGANAATWTPASLPGLKFWIDSSDASTVTASGGVASRVADKSGSGLHIEQTDPDLRPAYGTSTKNGFNVLTFDGGDSLQSANWSQAQPVTMFAVAQNTAEIDDGNRQIIGNTYPTSPVFYKAGGKWRLYAGAELVSTVNVDTEWHYLGGVVNSASSRYRLDGVQIKAGNTGSRPWDDSPITIGDSGEVWCGCGWIGNIAEVLIYSGVLSDSNISLVESYLHEKWFVTPPPTTAPPATTVPPTTLSPSTTAPPTTIAATTSTTVERAATTTVAPVLDIVVNAPVSSVPVATSAVVVQSQPASTPQATRSSKSPESVMSPETPTTTMPPTTTTTLPNNTGGTVAPRPPSAPSVMTGGAAVKVGNSTLQPTVERSDNQLVVTAGPLRAVLGSLNSAGQATALDNEGNIRLRTGDMIRIKAAGFKPGSALEAWLFSTPVLLGRTDVGTDGTVSATFTVPKDAPSGPHRVVLVTRTADDKPATLAVGVSVGEWKKETSLTVWLIVVPILLSVAGALVLPATRRRRITGKD